MAPELQAVLDSSRILERASGENFPVASRVLPASVRQDLMAIYGFARLVDDIGDEATGDRRALLDRVGLQIDDVFAGREDPGLHPLMRRLARTVHALSLPREPFERLLEANQQDQSVSRYETFPDLLAYCQLSANPVGHLVLLVLGAATRRRLIWSDAICTGLQLTEHWQDVAEDARSGRVYVPEEDLERFGVDVEDLVRRRPTQSFRRLMAFECDRARFLLDRGLPLVADLGGRPGLAVGAFVAGGRAALVAMGRAGHNVLSQAPRPRRLARLAALASTLGDAHVRRRTG